MLFRFSLYGFLKNQQYYEPFLLLAFLEKGLSFFMIGVLIAFREVMINIMEIPSGAIADLYGRRSSMIFSFSAYIISFVLFAVSDKYWQFFPAMFLFSIGEAFRTGTHKAMIFHWLKLEGRLDERTKIYGFTRSWSKFGSALSALIAGGLVFYSGKYSAIFWFSIIPYLLGIINLTGYPKELNLEMKDSVSITESMRQMFRVIIKSLKIPKLRGLFIESMGFQGYFKAFKDYVQPMLMALALTLPFFNQLPNAKRTALLIAFVYFVLFILSGFASRSAHVITDKKGGEEQASAFIWKITITIFLVMTAVLFFKWYAIAALLFVLLFLLQNIWYPLLITRIDHASESSMGATVLSIEQQAKSSFTMIIAPILGFCVDHAGLWPVGAIGLVISTCFWLFSRKNQIDKS